MVNLILLIVFTVISVVIGFCLSYFIILSKNKKAIKDQTAFDKEQAISIFLAYKHKRPTEQQIKAMVEAHKVNK
jgi:uncharacterized protein YneF (UPF0154 family)